MKTKSDSFFISKKHTWEPAAKGITRKIVGYNVTNMMVRVQFEKGAVGDPHSHPHTQTSYIVSGKFEVTIAGKVQILAAGDGFFVDPNLLHGAVCLEAGELIDTFSPWREEFL